MNLQNLKRGGELRKSIIAPDGHVIVVADSAQIEARVTAWLAGDEELLQLFRDGQDVYKYMASQIYRIPVEEVTKDQRFIGKIAVLGLGYGMGWAKFGHTLRTGAMGPAVDLPDQECMRIVGMYRTARSAIAKLWKAMDLLLYKLANRRSGTFGPLTHDDLFRIWMPNGLYLQYPFLTGDVDPVSDMMSNYRYFDYASGVAMRMGGNPDYLQGKKIYGGLLTENIVQALARIIVGQQMLTVSNHLKEAGGAFTGGPYRRVVTMTHDEIVVCVPTEEGQATLDMMVETMRTPPQWCRDIPLNAEGGFDVNYSK